MSPEGLLKPRNALAPEQLAIEWALARWIAARFVGREIVDPPDVFLTGEADHEVADRDRELPAVGVAVARDQHVPDAIVAVSVGLVALVVDCAMAADFARVSDQVPA